MYYINCVSTECMWWMVRICSPLPLPSAFRGEEGTCVPRTLYSSMVCLYTHVCTHIHTCIFIHIHTMKPCRYTRTLSPQRRADRSGWEETSPRLPHHCWCLPRSAGMMGEVEGRIQLKGSNLNTKSQYYTTHKHAGKHWQHAAVSPTITSIHTVQMPMLHAISWYW